MEKMAGYALGCFRFFSREFGGCVGVLFNGRNETERHVLKSSRMYRSTQLFMVVRSIYTRVVFSGTRKSVSYVKYVFFCTKFIEQVRKVPSAYQIHRLKQTTRKTMTTEVGDSAEGNQCSINAPILNQN